MASKGKKSNSKLPSDWRIHMFSDIHSTDDELDYDFGVDNPISVICQWNLDKENRSTIGIQSLQTCRKQFVHDLDENGSSGTCNADIHIVDSESASGGHGVRGLKSHETDSSGGEDINEVPLRGNTQERDSGRLGQEKFQTRVSLHGEQGLEQDPRRQVRSHSVTNAMLNRPGPLQSQRLSNTSAIHEHPHQVFKNQLESQLVLNPNKTHLHHDAVESASCPVTDYTIDNHYHQLKKQQVDLNVGKHLRTLKVDNSAPPSISHCFTGQRRHTEPHTGVSVSNPHVRDTDRDSSLNPINAQDVSEEATSQDMVGNSPRTRSRQLFRPLCVQSLDEKTGETTQYLPADDKAESPKTKNKSKGWEKICSMLRRKSKNNAMLEEAQEYEMSERISEVLADKSKKVKKGILRGCGSEQDKAEEASTVTGPVVSLDDRADTASISSLPDACSEGPPHKRKERRRNVSTIALKRSVNNLPTTSPNIPTSSLSSVSPPSSPLMQSTGIFDLQEDDTDSDTSSVTSDSQVSSDNVWDSGDSGGGREESVKEIIANLSRRTVEQVERENRVNFDPQLDCHSQVPEICQASNSLMTSNRSARPQSTNKAPSMPFTGPYGKVFTAKFLNCLGRKGSLNNVTNVSHVQKGTVLVTQLIRGELLHMTSSGRVMKRFEVDPGSEPWCACVTPRGHVAVTIKNPACVTVWSGNGALLQEFGHSVLQSPTGLACDRKGNFIVADERTNRVAVFNPDGQFLQYLTQSPPTCSPDNDNKSVEESNTTCDNKSVMDNEENQSDPQGNSVPSKTKKRVRINLGSPEIIVMDPNENIVHSGQITTASETENVEISHASEVGECTDTPEPYVFSLPRYVCVSASDHIIVSNSGSNSVKVFTPEGTYLRTIGTSGSKDGQLKVPYGVCCDQDNNIYVADHYNDRISVFSLEGEFLQHALTVVSGLCRPKSITICPAHVRKLFVAHGGLRAMEILVYGLEPTPRCISFTCDL